VKYTNAGGQVVISAEIESDGSLAVRVKDTGIGMTDAQLQDALKPFTRVESPDRARQGTGLGLPLTKALTEANRAKLNMSSAPNQGTTAEIVFPGTRVLAE
jgi:signal transduction histidine kinase